MNAKKLFSFLICILFLSLEQTYAQSPLETEVVKQLNSYRKKHGLGSVKYDTEVSKVALYHANYLTACSNTNYIVSKDKLSLSTLNEFV